MTEHIAEVVGGTPLQIITKTIVAAFAILWSHVDNVSSIVLLYGILVIVDVVLGTALARKRGDKMDRTRWLSGPAKKLGLTAALFMGASVIDGIIPGQFVLFGTSGYVAAALFLDAAKKYDSLTGLNVLEWIQQRIGGILGINSDK
jgi:hypothetical protein